MLKQLIRIQSNRKSWIPGRCGHSSFLHSVFRKTYGFKATQEWFNDVRLSALRVPGCSASFVSEDGLIMTNNHCSRGTRRQVQKGEDLASTAFFAPTLADERKY